jgi:biotin carboxyl carrier protein
MHEKPKQDLTKVILSPMPGSVVSLIVNVGDIVSYYLIGSFLI